MAYKFSRGDRGFGDIMFEDDSDTGIDFEADTIKLETNGVERVFVTNTGLGVGGSPSCQLHVKGDDARVRVDGDANSHPGLELSENGTRKWIIFNNYTNDDLTFKTNSDTRMSIEQDGNVGIGTTSPDALLHVAGDTMIVGTNFITGALQITGSGQSLITLHTRDADNLKEIVFLKDGNAAAAMQINSAEHFFLENEAAKDIILRTNNQNTIRVYGANQRVGINQPHGSTAANGALDVTGEVMITGSAHIENTIAIKQGSDPSTLDGYAHIYAKNDAGDAELFVRDEAGNVTKISPHNSQGEWEYFSKNTKTGKVFRVNMEKMIRKLEEITGESFIEEWHEDIK